MNKRQTLFNRIYDKTVYELSKAINKKYEHKVRDRLTNVIFPSFVPIVLAV